MDTSIIIASITSLSTLGGAAVAGLFLYKIAIRKEKTYQLNNKLLQAYKDLESYRELEKMYIEEIEKSNKGLKKEGIRRKIWNELKKKSKSAPSSNSRPAFLGNEIIRLSDLINLTK